MTTQPESIGLKCVDKFLANLPVHSDGYIKSGTSSAQRFQYWENEAHNEDSWEVATRMEIGDSLPSFPSILGPDIDLYLAIERVHHYNEPDIVFCGRIKGDSIGTVSIMDVMWVIARSLDALRHCCQNCVEVVGAINVAASEWVANLVLHQSLPVCLQVDGDIAWRLFAAGQVAHCAGLLMYGCFPCAVRAISAIGGSKPLHRSGAESVVVAGKERIGQSKLAIDI
jgi:hypothetical protein